MLNPSSLVRALILIILFASFSCVQAETKIFSRELSGGTLLRLKITADEVLSQQSYNPEEAALPLDAIDAGKIAIHLEQENNKAIHPALRRYEVKNIQAESIETITYNFRRDQPSLRNIVYLITLRIDGKTVQRVTSDPAPHFMKKPSYWAVFLNGQSFKLMPEAKKVSHK